MRESQAPGSNRARRPYEGRLDASHAWNASGRSRTCKCQGRAGYSRRGAPMPSQRECLDLFMARVGFEPTGTEV